MNALLVPQKTAVPVDSFEIVLTVFAYMNPLTLDLASWGFSAISWVRLFMWIHGSGH